MLGVADLLEGSSDLMFEVVKGEQNVSRMSEVIKVVFMYVCSVRVWWVPYEHFECSKCVAYMLRHLLLYVVWPSVMKIWNVKVWYDDFAKHVFDMFAYGLGAKMIIRLCYEKSMKWMICLYVVKMYMLDEYASGKLEYVACVIPLSKYVHMVICLLRVSAWTVMHEYKRSMSHEWNSKCIHMLKFVMSHLSMSLHKMLVCASSLGLKTWTLMWKTMVMAFEDPCCVRPSLRLWCHMVKEKIVLCKD